MFLEEDEQQDDGQRTDHGKRHHAAVIIAVLPQKRFRNAHRQRFHRGILHDNEGHHIVIPCVQERIDAYSDNAGLHQREQDLHQRAHFPGSVDAGGFVQTFGHGVKEGLYQRDRQRQGEGRVGKDQAGVAAQQPQLCIKNVQRRQNHHDGEHLNRHDRAEQCGFAPEPVAGKSISRGNRQHQRRQHGSDRNDDAVAEIGHIFWRLGDLDVVVQRDIHGNKVRGQNGQVVGRHHHPVDWEQQKDDRQQQRPVFQHTREFFADLHILRHLLTGYLRGSRLPCC